MTGTNDNCRLKYNLYTHITFVCVSVFFCLSNESIYLHLAKDDTVTSSCFINVHETYFSNGFLSYYFSLYFSVLFFSFYVLTNSSSFHNQMLQCIEYVRKHFVFILCVVVVVVDFYAVTFCSSHTFQFCRFFFTFYFVVCAIRGKFPMKKKKNKQQTYVITTRKCIHSLCAHLHPLIFFFIQLLYL